MATSKQEVKGRPLARHEWPVLEVCERINGADKGSADPLTPHQLSIYSSWLKMRLVDWQDSYPRSLGYDLAVKLLMEHAVAIAERLRRGDK